MSRNEHQPVQTGPVGCTAYLLQFAQCFYLVNRIHDPVVMIKNVFAQAMWRRIRLLM